MNIDELKTPEDILSREVFDEVYKLDSEFAKTGLLRALKQRAVEIGVGKDFDEFAAAYKADWKKTLKADKTDKPSVTAEAPDADPWERSNFKDWHEYDKEGRPSKVLDASLAEYILKEYHIFVISKIPYIYENGVYRPDETETRLKQIIQSYMHSRLINIGSVTNIYNLIIANHSIQKTFDDLNNFDRHWINFKNGFFDPIEWKMHPHAPKWLSINQIPHEFNPEAVPTGSITDNFVNFAVPDPADQEMLWQYFGYCLTTDTRLQKFIIFKGQGGTGKSQLIKIAEKMTGKDNTSSVSIEQLGDTFYPALLLGKLLNSCADIPSTAMETVAAIKKITGEDLIIANKKHGAMLNFHSYAKLMFSANKIPLNLDEKSEALYRRMLIICVDRKPRDDDKNPNLAEELETEIDYSIMKSVQALQRMYKQGKFTESDNSKNSVQELYMEADSVTAFIVERTKKMAGKSVKTSEFYAEYAKYCDDLGRTKLSLQSFHKSMKDKGYEKKHYSDGDRYLGIVLLDENALDADENGFVKVSGDIQEEMPFK